MSETPDLQMAPPAPEERPGRDRSELLDTIKTTAVAIALAMVIGAVLIALSNADVVESLEYIFSYPQDFFSRSWDAISTSYGALVKGSVGSPDALATTLNRSAPLICAGLGVTLAFRAGMFNIGSQGQLILGALAASYVGFTWDLPGFLLLPASVIAGVAAGALWGGISGFLKARAGAHEVITTIMLNQIAAVGVLAYALNQTAFQRPDDTLGRPQSPPVADSATFWRIGDVHVGVILALASAVLVWWILDRSKLGFELRAVGANPDASRTAGMSTAKVYTVAMLIAGAFGGLAAVMLINGDQAANSPTLAGTIGFDAITVALLGRATPIGTVLAGLLFGALAVGGTAMQTSSAATPPELTDVLQALIVLFVAAPALVRWIARLRRTEPSATFAAKGVTV